MSCKNLLKAFVPGTMLFLSLVSYSQNKVISGKVTDSRDGSGLAGVNVVAKGATTGTQTGAGGAYQISVSPSVTVLVFSSVGYATYEVNISGKTSMDVSMSLSTGSLAEVVVIGYGTRQKKDLTGAVTSITAKDFNKGTITTPEQLIAGKVAGVQVTSNGGAPGSGSTIRIRGGASLNASNSPLIVIDGVPVDNGGISGAANPLALINPNDIESFNILKDASATAIYGSRASNGVIIVTTKKGKSGKIRFNFSTQYSMSVLPKKAEIFSGDQIRDIVQSDFIARGSNDSTYLRLLGSSNTDWQDEVYDNASTFDNNLSMLGSFKNVPYRVSLGYLSQDGILRTGNLKRTSASISVTPRFFDDHLKVDLNLKGSINKSRFADEGAIGSAVRFDPTKPVYASSKRFGGFFEWQDPSSTTGLRDLSPLNPVGLLEQRTDKSEVQRSIGNIQFDYKLHFFPDLRANLNLGYDVAQGEGTIYVPDSAAS
ncbi:MAG TPA: SusC/RagA family TonB-linked outer membrane protein, partial [Chitinophagaceae bacterium]|nr:SusC/RagA family TonB-linked outer membrane protein [Chitinophagaceae bacterium]